MHVGARPELPPLYELELHLIPHALEQPRPPPRNHRMHDERELVNEPSHRERRRKLRPTQRDPSPRFLLEPPNSLDHIPPDKLGVPVDFPDATTFRIGFITSENATSLASIQSGHSPDAGRRHAPSISS